MLKIMHLLNKEAVQDPIDVVLSVPNSAHGIVRFCFILFYLFCYLNDSFPEVETEFEAIL